MSLPFLPDTLNNIVYDVAYLGSLAAISYIAKHAGSFIKAHTTLQQRAILSEIVNDGVVWAEHYIAGPGASKFAAVIKNARADLKSRGINVNLSEIESAVQAAYAKAKSTGLLASSGSAAVTNNSTVGK
jgi:hypothetical protein